MKKLALVFILTLSVIALSACGGKTKTLQMTWWSDGTEGAVMQTLLDDYEEETGVVIELVNIPYDDYETRLATMISGGEAPALSRVTEGHLNNFQANILPLDDVYTTTGFTNLFYNSKDEVISLPMDITANGMFINTTLLDANSVDYPAPGEPVWTWAQFETAMSALEGKTGVAAPGLMDPKAHRMMPLFYQAGVKIWDTAYTTSNLTDAEAVAVTQMVMDFYDDGLFAAEPYAGSNAADLFKTGEYGFHISGNWNVSGYQSITAFDWAVVPMPKGTNRGTILGGKSLAAFANSGMEEEAEAFIAWMAEGTQHDAYTGGVPYLTPRLGATVAYGDFADEYAVFLDEIANTDEMYVQDWLAQVMIPGMYPIINKFAEDCADPTNTLTALQLLTQLETDLKAAAATIE